MTSILQGSNTSLAVPDVDMRVLVTVRWLVATSRSTINMTNGSDTQVAASSVPDEYIWPSMLVNGLVNLTAMWGRTSGNLYKIDDYTWVVTHDPTNGDVIVITFSDF